MVGTTGNGDGEMALPGAGPADQHDVALLSKEAPACQVVDQRLIDRCAIELEVVEVLCKRQLGDGELVLDDRACFSLISAVSRSPTMR